MATRWIEAGGIQLRYDLTDGPPPTVVLVHEMGGMLESWDAVVGPLSVHARVLRYDQRGTGLSEKPPGAFTVLDSARDLAGLLEALAIAPPVVVVGCAVGAAVSATFAARFPQLLDGLVLLSPALVLDPARRPAVEARLHAIERDGVRGAFPDAYSLPAEARPRYDTLRLVADPRGLAATWRMLASLDMDAELARILCPTLVAAGRFDTARPPDHVRGMAMKIPGAEFTVLDSGHVMAIDTPDLVVGTIAGFIDRCGLR